MELGLRMFGVVMMLGDWLLRPVFWLLSLFGSSRLPPLRSELLTISATKLAEKIRNQEIMSRDVVEAYIARIRDVNGVINAVVQQRFDAALHEAQTVDSLIASGRKSPEQIGLDSPLLGVPITVKESCSVNSMSLSGGTVARFGMTAPRDGEAVGLLRNAGAIPLLVSNTPEYCLSWETYNKVVGRTRNPYDTRRTSGGSSGGEAALIASAASLIGVASDIAGSIRIPAMFTGIFGHKPTSCVISLNGHFPNSTDSNFQKFLTIGPLVRYAEDLTLMMKVMSGKEADKLRLHDQVDIKTLKVLYMMEAGKHVALMPVHEDIKRSMEKCVEHFKNTGAEVQDGRFHEMEESIEFSCSMFFGMTDVPNLLVDPKDPKVQKNLFVELIKCAFGLSIFTLPSLMYYFLHHTNAMIPRSKYDYYNEKSIELKNKFTKTLGTNGVFLYPTFPTAASHHNQTFLRMAGVMYTMVFNILGLPSTHVPLGLDKNGLPIGIQVVAAPYQDRLCIAVAVELEKEFGGWIPPPPPYRS